MQKKYRYIKLLILWCMLALITSCEKNLAVENSAHYHSFEQIFEDFWRRMNQRYVLWDIDKTDWDSVYNIYKPKFQKLSLKEVNDVKQSAKYFEEMTATLMDSHFRITFEHEHIQGVSIYPSLAKKTSLDTIASPISLAFLAKRYLDAGYLSGSSIIPEDSQESLFVLAGTINQEIFYFNCNRFLLTKAFIQEEKGEIQDAMNFFFRELRSQSIKGLIIDVRGNQGGDLADLNFVIGNLIKEPLHFGYTRHKVGPNRLDYSQWQNALIRPKEGAIKFKKPIILLVDRYSASVSESLAMAIRSLHNGTIVGETTWGATCPVSDSKLLNGGSFELKGFMRATMSSLAFKYLDDKVYEGKGVKPDFYAPLDTTLVNAGRDSQLERAVQLLNDGI